MPLTNINSDWMSNASYGLCIILYYAGPYFASWGVTIWSTLGGRALKRIFNCLCNTKTPYNLLTLAPQCTAFVHIILCESLICILGM